MAQEHDLSGSSEYHISSTMWIEYDWTAYVRVTRHDMEVTDVAIKYPVLLHFDQLDAPVTLTEAQAYTLGIAPDSPEFKTITSVLQRAAEVLAERQAYDLYNNYAEDRSDYAYDAWKDSQWEKSHG